MGYKILIADDEPEIRDLLRLYLENEQYEVVEAEDGRQALSLLREKKPDLCVLDIMMPKMDGYHVLQELRKESNIPVLILSAKDADSEKILGLNLGADDYISKPFSIRQVIARVKAVLRRTKAAANKDEADDQLAFETLLLDTRRIRATIDGQEVPLTKKEFEILRLLLENRGNVFSREEILAHVWKDEVYVLDRTIDVNITRLRKKIGRYGKNIVTRLGFGYCFDC